MLGKKAILEGLGCRVVFLTVTFSVQTARSVMGGKLLVLTVNFVWITANCRKFFKRWEYQTT